MAWGEAMVWRRSEVNEALVALYLRLCGYFTTGLVLHSAEWGQNRTEIDCLGVRHPYHSQPDRDVELPSFLGIRQGELDLILCEVKSKTDEMEFNERLRTDPEALRALLRWVGVFQESQIGAAADRVRPLLEKGIEPEQARVGVLEGACRVRALLCCPPCRAVECSGHWWLTGSEIFRFANECFNPPRRRDTCSTRYNFRLWGPQLGHVVEYFKGQKGDGDLQGLYSYLGAA